MIDKYNIGAVLKDIIKQRGFTQEEFAECTGVGLSSLKKYISGQVAYSVEVLDIFSITLQCSYDFLLGKSLTPENELRDIKNATRLTDGALQIIEYYANEYDTNKESKKYLDTLSNIIQSNFIIERIIDYLYIDRNNEYILDEDEGDSFITKSIFIGNESLTTPDIEDAYLLGIMRALTEAKQNIGLDVSRKIRNYKTKKYD